MLAFDSDVHANTCDTNAYSSNASGDSGIRTNNALASTEDVLDVFADEAVSACAAISSHRDATRNSSELIKSEFVVVHWFEGVVEVFPSMNTPSPESMAEVMTGIKRCCDLAHTGNASSQTDYLARRFIALPTDLLQVDPHLDAKMREHPLLMAAPACNLGFLMYYPLPNISG